MANNITVLADETLGGVKREYRSVKRKAGIGERIKVVAIHPNSRKLGRVRLGEVFTARHVDCDGDILRVEERDIGGLISPGWGGLREYVVLEPTDIVRIPDEAGFRDKRMRVVERKAGVGDRVIIVNEGRESVGGLYYRVAIREHALRLRIRMVVENTTILWRS